MSYEHFYYEDEEQLVPRIENIMLDVSDGKVTATVEFSEPPSLFSLLCGRWNRTRYSQKYQRFSKMSFLYPKSEGYIHHWIDVITGDTAADYVKERLDNLMLLKEQPNDIRNDTVPVQ